MIDPRYDKLGRAVFRGDLGYDELPSNYGEELQAASYYEADEDDEVEEDDDDD